MVRFNTVFLLLNHTFILSILLHNSGHTERFLQKTAKSTTRQVWRNHLIINAMTPF